MLAGPLQPRPLAQAHAACLSGRSGAAPARASSRGMLVGPLRSCPRSCQLARNACRAVRSRFRSRRLVRG
eukprot:3220227-Pyramimonas_sp.AAC.1